jgi:hypothetical protein
MSDEISEYERKRRIEVAKQRGLHPAPPREKLSKHKLLANPNSGPMQRTVAIPKNDTEASKVVRKYTDKLKRYFPNWPHPGIGNPLSEADEIEEYKKLLSEYNLDMESAQASDNKRLVQQQNAARKKAKSQGHNLQTIDIVLNEAKRAISLMFTPVSKPLAGSAKPAGESDNDLASRTTNFGIDEKDVAILKAMNKHTHMISAVDIAEGPGCPTVKICRERLHRLEKKNCTFHRGKRAVWGITDAGKLVIAAPQTSL